MTRPASARRYAAYVAYRRVAPDERWAKLLHDALERWRTPRSLIEAGKRDRVTPVFLDERELEPTHDLPGDLKRALSASEFLIVVCSPRTRSEGWVQKEVEWFLDEHGPARIILFRIEGEPDDAYPATLRNKNDGLFEFLSVDLTHAPVGRAAVRRALPRVVARIIDCPFGELEDRDNRRLQVRRRRWTMALVVLTLALSGLSIFAWRQRNEARTAEALATRHLALSESRRMAYTSLSTQRLPGLSFQLARAALARGITNTALAASYEALVFNRPVGRLDESGRSETRLIAWSPGGAHLAIATKESVSLWTSGGALTSRIEPPDRVSAFPFKFIDNGQEQAIVYREVVGLKWRDPRTVVVTYAHFAPGGGARTTYAFDVGGAPVTVLGSQRERSGHVHAAPSGDRFLVVSQDKQVALLDGDGEALRRWPGPVRSVVWSPQGYPLRAQHPQRGRDGP